MVDGNSIALDAVGTGTGVSDRKMLKVPFRGRGFAPTTFPILGWITLVVVLGFWQFSTGMGWVSPTFLPSPWAIWLALKGLAISGQLEADLSASLYRIAIGWSSGTVIGLVVGISMGLFSVARSIGAPAISALFPIPKLALLPLIILWLGIGELSKVVTIGFAVFFPTAITTYTAIDSVPRNLIRMSQGFGVPTLSIIWKTVLPGAYPGILAGMRISVATALLTMVAAEMIGANNGLGAFVLLQGSLMRSNELLAGVVVISILGISVGMAISRLEKALFRWR